MATLIDTNVLLRSVQPMHPMHSSAVQAVETLLKRQEPLVIAIQNAAEFWNAATRPEANNGLGWTIDETRKELDRIGSFFAVIHETAASFAHWQFLVTSCSVRGAQVHDARLASVMMAYGIRQILTFNVSDFARYTEVEALHPDSVAVDR